MYTYNMHRYGLDAIPHEKISHGSRPRLISQDQPVAATRVGFPIWQLQSCFFLRCLLNTKREAYVDGEHCSLILYDSRL